MMEKHEKKQQEIRSKETEQTDKVLKPKETQIGMYTDKL